MRRYVQHEPFNIYCFEADHWQHPVHKHTYYEIIFILKGKGTHTINDNTFAYQKGDIFLLGPEDYHEFRIRSKTEFCYIRFVESLFSIDKNGRWGQVLNLLLHTSFQSKGSIVQDNHEKERLFQLMNVLRIEYERRGPDFEILRESMMKVIMTILSRNIVRQSLPSRKSSNETSLEEIFLYIRQHIYQPELLRIDRVCKQFNYAPSYLSIFFKKHTGESLKHYIDKYRVKLIETRLLYSHSTLGQIASEFGFTDESHLSKLFRKYNGVSPGDFRAKTG